MEIIMIKELLTSWFGENKVKISSPVVGSFIGSWVLFNWKHFLLLFWGEGALDVRLEVFDAVLTSSNYSVWLWPLLVALLYAFGLPYLNVLSHKLLKRAEEWRHNEVVDIDIIKAKRKAELNEELYKGDPNNAYLGRKLEAELKKKDAEAEKARVDAEMAIAEQKGLNLENDQLEALKKLEEKKLAEETRRGEREQQAHELAKSKHHQEIVNNNFPTLYLFLDNLSKSLMEDNFYLSIGLMSESIAISFGYDDVNSMLTDKSFTLDQLENLACVIYEDQTYLKNLKENIAKHGESIKETDLFDHLVSTFEQVDKFRFIPTDSMDDIVKDYVDDNGHFFDLVNDEHVGGATAETNAHSFGVEYVEFHSVQKVNNGQYVADATVNIQGEMDDDRPYSGHEIDASIQLVYKPIIGRNGYDTPDIEVQSASLNREY